MDPLDFRAIERLLIVVGAILAVYLGYALFRSLPHERSTNGKLVFPGGVSVHLARTGPGAFFAIFGAMVLITAIKAPLKMGETDGAKTNKIALRYVNTPAGGEVLLRSQSKLTEAMRLANQTAQHIKLSGRNNANMQEAGIALTRLKLELMSLLWETNWPDYNGFETAVLNDSLSDATNRQPALIAPLELYNTGTPQTP